MPRLSSKLSELQPRYTAVVVGSGYGGGVAASRLARAGQRVCVLERGREFALGEFPDTEVEAAEQMQLSLPGQAVRHIGSELGLFDFHVEKEVTVLRGCGLGGTSLINANVALEADEKVFEDPRWPRELVADMDGLRLGARRALAVLEPKTYPDDWPKLAKLEAHRRSGEAMGEPWAKTPINVSFEDRVNPFGVSQARCTLCGDCVSGCNVGAKNTTAMNYLPDAWNHGADIFTEVSVDRVERRGDLWAVHISPTASGREVFDPGREMVVLAELVILAAGTLGSTEILLRSRAKGLSTSPRLGHGFSGNADVLAFGYNNDVRIDGVGMGTRKVDPKHPVGPTITSVIDGRTAGRPLAQQFVIEEGALPGSIEAIYPASLRAAARKWGTDTDEGFLDALNEKQRELVSRLPDGAHHGAVAHTQTYLGMGHDSCGGVMRLDDEGRLRLDWPKAEHEPVIEGLNQKILQATAANGGTFVPNPMWSNRIESDLITVHPLGGCGMGDSAETGVTNHKGQVFSEAAGTAVHPGLYVADGSVLPMSAGVNPLLTISAIAERDMALLAAERGWTIDYDPRSRPVTPREPEPPPGVGVRFTERMAGWVGLGGSYS
ncbi:MAG: GMC family oxidoreductase, partial [Myxococcales bacterium]|nr:GMC family oxidoreductase [Myxococcales bacterium]